MLSSLILFAITLSIDSLGVGITYGIRNIKVGTYEKLILFTMSFIIVLFSSSIGLIFLNFLPESFSNILGGFSLALMGIWIIWQTLKEDTGVVEILKDPSLSDFDGSQTIDSKEAIYLGFAMSADSLICGIGLSMMSNFSMLFPILVATFQLLFLSSGIVLGKKIKSISSFSPAIWSRIAGILLILLSIIKIIH